jgi:hypothetical protein
VKRISFFCSLIVALLVALPAIAIDDGKGWYIETLPNSGTPELRVGDIWTVEIPSGGVRGRIVVVALPGDEIVSIDDETGQITHKTGLDPVMQLADFGITADDEVACEANIERGTEIVSFKAVPRCGFKCPSFPAKGYRKFKAGRYTFEVGDSGDSTLSDDPHPWCDAGGVYAIRLQLEGGGFLSLNLVKKGVLLPFRPIVSPAASARALTKLRLLQEESASYQDKKTHGMLPGQRQ